MRLDKLQANSKYGVVVRAVRKASSEVQGATRRDTYMGVWSAKVYFSTWNALQV